MSFEGRLSATGVRVELGGTVPFSAAFSGRSD